MRNLFSLLFIISVFQASAQFSEIYQVKIEEAESSYHLKEYKKSALAYATAFESNGGRAFWVHRYNAACSFALSGDTESAFRHLQHLAYENKYVKIDHIREDADLVSLHQDQRWEKLLEQIILNKDEKDKYLEPDLVQMLDSVYSMDQDILNEQLAVAKQYGWESEELTELNKRKDSIFKITRSLVTQLLDKRGWLGAEVVGSRGNSALFLVIQHSDLTTQQKYLPMMQQAVKEGKARGSSLALLEDRVNLKTGKKQIYGSQIGRLEDQSNYVRALEDPKNVDQRRAEVGLEPLNDYTKNWDFTFEPEEYLKKLTIYEEILKKEYESRKKE